MGDRYYSENYGLLAELDQAGCLYVVRLREQAIIRVIADPPLTDEDRQAGVVRQARVVWVDTPTAGTLVLATNLEPTDNPAALVAQIYRRRWQNEGFFAGSSVCWAVATGWPRASAE